MPKRLRNYPVYLAPKIHGHMNEDIPEIYDEKRNEYLDPNNIDDKIKIYKRQVKGWFLDRGSRLLRGENNGFVVIMISASYIEGVQQYIAGETSERNSRDFFKRGLERIFSLSVDDEKLNDFYKQVRCGLFHNGMSGGQVIISNESEHPIDFSQTGTIIINPKRFLNEIRNDFNRYISLLKDVGNIDEREKFNRMFSVVQ
ncbi:hypothetical protein [Desulfosporosinus shakirovi]|uniref:hypothetical protein n=1 Tax=Desulfosporosinus shakirovi TaxID=2885154 RepID=UPI001E57D306|nr:hypothetical protein [Desulfosporosinus sp. SRJS8]MCB8817382.1 hypothetical protein [Desulfosporosinus sp. SRJS8]